MTNPYAPPPDDHRRDADGDAPTDAPTGAPGPQPGRDLPAERYGRRPAAPQSPRRPEDPAAFEALRSRLGLFLLLLVASLLVLTLPLPFQAASIVFSAWAVVVGARAVAAAWRAGIRRAAVPLAAALVGIAMWMTLSAALQLALWPVLQDRQDCLREALTTSARESCEDRYQRDIEDRLNGLMRPADA
ncbi:hypothetical protein [Actinotalea sp. Marseille-Q4924]|uniref:hypothetical protein n=1 Tax=Actinotalea sp. Marseille-Q4924 TaxID=2866571 RepID=UPI001CE41234|nr:hypothetical protein [Actinotalea sp. Marseille-Q4924]